MIWTITEQKDSNVRAKSNVQSTGEQSISKSPITEEETKPSHKLDTNSYYIQSHRPMELFNGDLIITLNNSIDAVNGEIELKMVDKNTSKTEIAGKKKIGDIINFGKYVISLLSLERNISTYDLIIKIEVKK